MAKVKIIYSYLFCILVCSSVVGQDIVGHDPQAAHQELRACVKEFYESQLGVRETGGDNRGFHVEKYLKTTGLGPGYAWCAAFVSWCYQQAGIVAPSSAWVPDYAGKEFRIYQRGKFQKREPQTGDVFMIWFEKLGRPAHIGFVDQWDKQWIATVEGNTNESGSREGDGVYKKRRLRKQVWAVSNFIDRE